MLVMNESFIILSVIGGQSEGLWILLQPLSRFGWYPLHPLALARGQEGIGGGLPLSSSRKSRTR